MSLATVQREFKILPIGLIDEPELPSRSSMSDEKLDELVQSIRAIGLQQPIVVAFTDPRYEVIAGHRRRIACGRAGLLEMPCVVYPSKSAAQEAVKFAENYYREPLNPADEAIWFSELLERDCGGDVDVLAARLSLKRGYVENRLLLFQGCADVFRALQEDKIKIGVAQQLNRITDRAFRLSYLDAAVKGGATVAMVAGWVSDWQRHAGLNPPSATPGASSAAPSPVVETNYFRCIVCGGTHDVPTMQPVNVHSYCRLAILDKVLAAYRGDDVNPEQLGDPRRI